MSEKQTTKKQKGITTMEIIMIARNDLVLSTVNHRGTKNRKIQGTTWLEGSEPIVVTPEGKKFKVLSGACRVTFLTGTDIFPCIVVTVDISTPALEAEAIARYKAQSLSISLQNLVKFGQDKVGWNLGRYLAKGGETAFRLDMLPLLEDYNPCPFEVADTDEDKKRISEYNKGLSALLFRACMLGGDMARDYVDSKPNITKGLRVAFDAAVKAKARGLTWADACIEGNAEGRKEIEKLAAEAKGKKEEKKTEKIDLTLLCASIRECVHISAEGKDIATYIIGHLSNTNNELLEKLAKVFPSNSKGMKNGNGRK